VGSGGNLVDYLTILSVLRLSIDKSRIMPKGMQVMKMFSLNNSGLENTNEYT
jgi:hypothetical protein